MKQRTVRMEREISPYRQAPRGMMSRLSSGQEEDPETPLETEGLLSQESPDEGEAANDSVESDRSDDMDRKPFLSALWQSSLPDDMVADIRSSPLLSCSRLTELTSSLENLLS